MKEFILDVQQGGGVSIAQFCEISNAIASAPPGPVLITVAPFGPEHSKEYELRVSGRDRIFLEALAEFLASFGSISGAMVFDREDTVPELHPFTLQELNRTLIWYGASAHPCQGEDKDLADKIEMFMTEMQYRVKKAKEIRSAENCANAKEERGKLFHCGECHDINEGYKFLPNWKPKDGEQR
ncbi:MAG: hypothetical protein LLG45_13150 [Actinomycetia bacterium]|nr:hypothetical protein [Actinomycetes bacterium]